MGNIFTKYLEEKKKNEGLKNEPGPVITVSREYGCYANRIATLIADALTLENIRKGHKKEWSCVSHHILEDAAKQLEIDPIDISHIFGAQEKGFWEDFKLSLSKEKKYTSDSNIKRIVGKVVKAYAEQGNKVIVGRAGCFLTEHLKFSFHIKLHAPKEWRALQIQDRFNLKITDAMDQVEEVDRKRDLFMSFYRGKKHEDELFDISFNRKTISEDEIVETVVKMVKSRGFI